MKKTITEANVNSPCPECEWPTKFWVMTPIGEMCTDCAEDYEERRLFSYDNDQS